mgnify:CR=1 FL=1
MGFFNGLRSEKAKGLAYLLSGLFLVCLFIGWRFYNARILSFKTDNVSASSESQSSNPVSINIPSIGLTLPLEESAIVDGVWQISYKGASHLDKSADPGETGNMVIYGHNKTSLFGPIRWLKEGDLIEIKNEEGALYSYRVVKTVITTPADIEYVLPKSEEILTLYTCTGLLDSKRHIVLAKRA